MAQAYLVPRLSYRVEFEQPGIANASGGVTSFNGRTGVVTLASGDVTTALGFTPGQGTVTGTGTAGQISYWDSSSDQVGSANLLWTNANSQLTIISNNAAGFTIGQNGLTNPAFAVDTSTANSGTGIGVKSAAPAGGVDISTISSGTNENLRISAKGTGTISIGSNSSGNIFMVHSTQFSTKITAYQNITTAGWGIPAIYGSGRVTAQAAAVASVATYTVGAADGSFYISSNVNVTAFSVGTFNVTCTYTDEGNTSRTVTFNFSSITGTLGIAIAAAGAFEGIPLHIRCKASTAITIATTGTFTSLTYNVEGSIIQIA